MKSVFIILKLAKNKEIENESYFFGILITLISYYLIYLNYKSSDTAIALGTYFTFPFFMVLIPYLIGINFKNSKDQKKRKLMQVLMISAISSGLFIIIFYKYTFGITEVLGLKKSF